MNTIGELIERNARYYPNREAFVFETRRLTHRQFADRAKRIAGGLHALGMRRQDRVAILAMNRLEYFELQAAAEWAGYLSVMVNYRLAAPEIAYILKDAAPHALVFEEQYTDVVAALRTDCPDISHYICIGQAPDWAVAFDAVAASELPDGPPYRARPTDYVYLFYTSGTTGKPKGVPWRQSMACRTARLSAATSEITGDARVLQVTPAFHIGGKGYPLGAMWSGATTVLHRAFDPVKMLEAIESEGITFTFMVAAMLQAVLDASKARRYDLSSVRTICSASAPIPVPLLRQGIELLGPVFSVQYGMTELGSVAVLPRHEVKPDGTPDEVRRLASVGHVIPEIEFRLVDEAGNDCRPGEPGEVIVQSETQLDGYWNNSVATVAAIRDGWYHTGDIGVLDDEGYLFLVDRKKDMIISGGENIYSREVEDAVLSHPDVLEVAVFGIPDRKWVEAVKAVAVRRPGGTVTEAELIAHCRTHIAGYKCPRSVEFVPELPRMATGKVNKVALRERYRG